ncbi:hypothetical protein [Microbulbifer agarilyticus]
MLKQKLWLFILVSGLYLVAPAVSANQLTGKINQVGCHIEKDMCFVYIDVEIPNEASQCIKNDSLRWGPEVSNSASVAHSIMLTAMTAGKRVTFGGVDQGCFSGYSTFIYLKILN